MYAAAFVEAAMQQVDRMPNSHGHGFQQLLHAQQPQPSHHLCDVGTRTTNTASDKRYSRGWLGHGANSPVLKESTKSGQNKGGPQGQGPAARGNGGRQGAMKKQNLPQTINICEQTVEGQV
jgi:hypothetical protein